MKCNNHKCFLACIIMLLTMKSFTQVTGDFQTKNVSGNWSDFNAWNVYNGTAWVPAIPGQLPGAATNVFVQLGHTISVTDPYAVCKDLNITNPTGGGKVTFTSAASILNLKGNFILTNGANCFGTWTPGAKIVFSGTGDQGFTGLSVFAVFLNIEVNKPSGTLTTSSNFRFESFTLTSGNFNVGDKYEMQGNSPGATITINGGVWKQDSSTTKINNSGNPTSPIGPVRINGGTMILASSNKTGGLQFSTLDVTNKGVLTLENFIGLINMSSLNVDATSIFNTALTTTPLPSSVTFNGIVNYNYSGDQTISAATYSYLKLSGSGTKTLGAPINIPANGTLEMSGVAASPAFSLGSYSLNVSATGTNLLYTSSSAQTATANEWNSNFQNITINNLAGVSMAGLTRTISGSLNLTSGAFNIGSHGSLTLDNPFVNRTNGFIAGTSTSDVTVTGTSEGTVVMPLSSNIGLHNITVSGTRKLTIIGNYNISLSGQLNIGSAATYDNGGESQLTDGGGSIVINGKFINRDKDNFTGTNGAIPGIIPTLNTGSTIEYGLAGDQLVTGRIDYQNITFSGSGTKTTLNTFTPAGTVYITGSAIVNADGHNIGDGTTLTNFSMDGGRLILGTTGTQPMMAGSYNLTGGVVQFNGGSLQTIRSKSYQNIEVTGVGVSNSDGNITLNANGTFTVKGGGIFEINDNNIVGVGGTQTVTIENGGIFRCGNKEGFNGFTATLTDNASIHSNITNIQLKPGSTVEYMRTGDQSISNFNNLVYQNLSLSGSGTKTAPADTLIVQGNLTKSGTSIFAHHKGTVLLNANAMQSFAGLTYNNLVLTNGTKTTFGTSTVIDSIKINTGTALSIRAADTIILHSDASGTARVGQVNGSINYNNTGLFLVERYIPAKKAWRFLAVPVNSTQTIKKAWQEGALTGSDNLKNGYGTQITSNNTNWSSLGFDNYSSGGPSMKMYNAANDNYTGIASTLINFDPATGGYMTFIRGDRSATAATSPVTSTTLRTTGKLYTGNQPVISVLKGKIVPVNNPYASQLDLRKLSGSYNIFYYVFDPNQSGSYGFGAFQTLSWNGHDYDVIPGSGSYGATNNVIESGQAFFVSTLGADTSLQITETVKTSIAKAVIPFTPAGLPSTLRANLYRVPSDGTGILVDGVLTNAGENFSNEIDGMDAKKLFNSGENLSIKSGNALLAVERRAVFHAHDTLLFSLSGLIAGQYRVRIISAGLEQTGLSAFMEDNYLRTRLPVSLAGTAEINFIVTADAASFAADRFRLVFSAAEGPLPVTFIACNAYRYNENIRVEWKVENESAIKYYEVEHSPDGNTFSSGNIIQANNVTSRSTYAWKDENPLEGYNYYRIKCVGIDEDVKYSKIMKVWMPQAQSYFRVAPDPVKDGRIQLHFFNQLPGNYKISIVNKAGALMATQQFNNPGSNGTIIIKKESLSHGIYTLIIRKPGNSIEQLNFLY